MESASSQTNQNCGCIKRRNVLSSLALTVAAATLSPFRNLLAQTPTPQEKESTETKVMGMGSHLLQGKHPIDQIDAYVCGLHFYNGDMGRQVIAHHFCSHRSESFCSASSMILTSLTPGSLGLSTLLAHNFWGGCPTRRSDIGTAISLKSNRAS
jgi:hypothetical protein